MFIIKTKYKWLIIGSMVLLTLTISGFYLIKDIKDNTKMENSNENNQINKNNNEYRNDYFSVDIPNAWALTESNKDTVSFEVNGNIIAKILINPDYKDGKSTSSLMSWLGMHAYVKNESDDKDLGNYIMKKVLVGWETSAAEEANGVAQSPDELHYFYLTKEENLLVDFCFFTNYITEDDVDEIANSLKLIK